MGKTAYMFLFTEWDGQGDERGASLKKWPPFAQNSPPDVATMEQISEKINKKTADLLGSNFEEEKKLLFCHSECSLEVIDSDAEPNWQKVWGAVVDRNAISGEGNSEKLGKMAGRIVQGKRKSKRPPALFFTPRPGESTPQAVEQYKLFMYTCNAGSSDDLVYCVAGWLAETAQYLKSVEVLKYCEREY